MIESVRVSEDAFDQLNITDSANDPTQHFYPVFIVGRDEQGGVAARRTSVCLENPSTRVSESFSITFGSLGSAADLDTQVAPDPDAPVGSGQAPWRILLGFVSWNGTRFVSVRNPTMTASRAATSVCAPARSSASATASCCARRHARVPDKAALVVDNTDGGQMRFGLHDSLRQRRAGVHREFTGRRDRRGQDPRRHRRRRAGRDRESSPMASKCRCPRGSRRRRWIRAKQRCRSRCSRASSSPRRCRRSRPNELLDAAAARLPRRSVDASSAWFAGNPPWPWRPGPWSCPASATYVVMGFVAEERLMDKMNVVTFRVHQSRAGRGGTHLAGRQADHRGRRGRERNRGADGTNARTAGADRRGSAAGCRRRLRHARCSIGRSCSPSTDGRGRTTG